MKRDAIPTLSVLPSVQNLLIPDDLAPEHSLIECICDDLKNRYMELGVIVAYDNIPKKYRSTIYRTMKSIARLYSDFQYVEEEKAGYMKNFRRSWPIDDPKQPRQDPD